jgi:hypothetical protein
MIRKEITIDNNEAVVHPALKDFRAIIGRIAIAIALSSCEGVSTGGGSVSPVRDEDLFCFPADDNPNPLMCGCFNELENSNNIYGICVSGWEVAGIPDETDVPFSIPPIKVTKVQRQ